MGYEWHDRRRDEFGRFAEENPQKPVQLHVRMTEARAATVRAAALAAQQDLCEYVAEAVDARLRKEGRVTEDG